MTDLATLYQTRLRRHYRQLVHYLTQIFNDHVVLILLIGIGFGAISYRQFLMQLESHPGYRWGVIIGLALLHALILTIGRPLWFLDEADSLYLLPQGHRFDAVWRKGSFLGALFPFLSQCVLVGISWPLCQFLWRDQVGVRGLILVLALLCLRLSRCGQYIVQAYGGRTIPAVGWLTGYVISSLLILGVPTQWGAVSVLGVIMMIMIGFLYRMKAVTARPIDLLSAITLDQERKQRLARILGIFVDIPQMNELTVRRAWLDPMLKLFRVRQNLYVLRYSRQIVRNRSISQMILTVNAFCGLLLAVSSSIWLQIGIGWLGFLLISIQLFPLLDPNQDSVLLHIYPHTDGRVRGFRHVLTVVLMLSMVLGLLVLTATGQGIRWLALISVFWLLGISLIAWLYLPWWAKRLMNQRKGGMT